MPFDFSGIVMQNFGDSPCGYFPERISTSEGLYSHWLIDAAGNDFPLKNLYSQLLKKGFRRYAGVFYSQKCKACKECLPIRIPVSSFSMSKSQKTVWHKNQDVEVRYSKCDSSWIYCDLRSYFDYQTTEGTDPVNYNSSKYNMVRQFITVEKVLLFKNYSSRVHNEKMSFDQAKKQLLEMHLGYTGVFDMEYYLGDRLIAVGLMDFTEDENGKINALSSNYFFYDVSKDILKRSPGVFSILKEIELSKNLGCRYYYLGFYLKECKSMKYKARFKPYEILVNGEWVCGDESASGDVAERPQRSEDLQQATDGDERSRDARKEKINTNFIYKIDLPPENDEFNDNICLVTKDIPLQLLYSAYMQGIFPWFDEDKSQPVMWFCPDPRFVIFPQELHVSKSIRKFLKHSPYTYTMDKAFEQVMQGCRKMNRSDQDGTWIGEKMIRAYTRFYEEGFAHSFEVWHDGRLAGGFYGILIGSVFCGESMFTIEPDSSKSAFVLFARAFTACGGKLIDCQCYTDNMARYGAVEISREDFLQLERAFLFTPLQKNLKTELENQWKAAEKRQAD